MQKPVTAASVTAATRDAKHHAELPASWPGGARGSPSLLGGPRDWAAACPSALETPAQCPPPTGGPARTLPSVPRPQDGLPEPCPSRHIQQKWRLHGCLQPHCLQPRRPLWEAVQLQAVQVLAAPPSPRPHPQAFLELELSLSPAPGRHPTGERKELMT